MKTILTINAGSSSLKFQLFSDDTVLAKGMIGNIGLYSSYFKMNSEKGTAKGHCPIPDHSCAIEKMLNLLTNNEYGMLSSLAAIDAVGHRVLHGGSKFAESVIINDEVIAAIEENIPLGPLHNPANLMGIKACREVMPDTPMVAVFDTAFHQTMPPRAYMYGLPYEIYEKHHVRRYGFHGTSHRYVSQRSEMLGFSLVGSRMIVAHLGNGSSLSAIADGKCVDTTMGLTPLEGLLMGTRSGSLDPSVIPFLCDKLELSVKEVEELLNKKSGLLGIAGTPDMAEVNRLADEEHDEKAILARDMLVYQIAKYIGAFAVAMGGLDTLVFTGGIGENSAVIRQLVTDQLSLFGVHLDREKNASILPGSGYEGLISTPESNVRVCIIPTNEELMIARDTASLL